MSDSSGKIVWGGGAAVIVLAVIVIVFYTGGSPDVLSGDDEQRIAAVQKVAVNGSDDAGETLAKVVANDPSPRVRREALAGLSHYLKPAHRGIVMKSTKDTDPRVRVIAVEVLGQYGDKAATTDLTKMVQRESKKETDKRDDKFMKAALRGLVKCEDPQSIVTLLERAEKGATREIKLVAMKGLLSKLGVRMSRERDPKDRAGWRDLIQRWKQSRRVRDAYAAAGKTLHSRPQDLLGKDWHPERRRSRQ
ncbi:MAG: HEAT repeat domain-containing protein [Phycisphaerae bacterium]|nr:HEAT repeat domain-containing protein [Phycisphaerae bacterium]